MKLVFAGTPAFAVPSLAALIEAGHEIRAVLTQPDRPAGRSRRLTSSPVKQLAVHRGLTVLQPESLAGFAPTLTGLDPDAMIVIAYGLILPRAILETPRHGCINVHASLLPRWRGAAPIARAIEAGDTETGVTIMQMDEGLDTGPILLTARAPIADTDTALTLHDRLAALGARTLTEALERLGHGALVPRPQDETLACYARKLSKQEAAIDWSQPAAVLHRKVRAFNPYPVAATAWRGKRLRLWEVGPLVPGAGDTPGTVLGADVRGLRVATGEGILTITRLQLEGGKRLPAGDFLRGHRLAAGERLGEGVRRAMR